METKVFHNDICRLCLWKKNCILHIFGPTGASEMIRTVFPFTVSAGDNHPQGICTQCLYKLEQLHEFYSACIRSNDKLVKYNLLECPVGLSDEVIVEVPVKLEPGEDPLAVGMSEMPDDDQDEPTSVQMSVPEIISPQVQNIARAPTRDAAIQTVMDNISSSVAGETDMPSCFTEDQPSPDHSITKAVTSGSTRFSCKKCSKTFQTRASWDLHYCSRPPEILLNCQFCNRSFSTMKMLSLHKKTHIKLIPPCDSCKRTFKSQRDYNTHSQTDCLVTKAFLNDHLYSATHQPRSSFKAPVLVCRLCKIRCSTKAVYGKHLKSRQHRVSVYRNSHSRHSL